MNPRRPAVRPWTASGMASRPKKPARGDTQRIAACRGDVKRRDDTCGRDFPDLIAPSVVDREPQISVGALYDELRDGRRCGWPCRRTPKAR
jgi:hypothetical protein